MMARSHSRCFALLVLWFRRSSPRVNEWRLFLRHFYFYFLHMFPDHVERVLICGWTKGKKRRNVPGKWAEDVLVLMSGISFSFFPSVEWYQMRTICKKDLASRAKYNQRRPYSGIHWMSTRKPTSNLSPISKRPVALEFLKDPSRTQFPTTSSTT